MKVGAFQVSDSLPELYGPHALAQLQPWIDVGGVGSMTMSLLEDHFHARLFGELNRPDSFFDYTRYRPIVHLVAGRRQIHVPNSFINYIRQPDSNDFLLFHLLEPHMLGKVYADSVLKVLQQFDVKRYCLIGSMYDAVPHTRPLIVTGRASGSGPAEEELRELGIQASAYEGPTTITILVSQEAPKYNIEVMSLIVHLPQYVRLEKDYAGTLRLMEVLCSLYNLPLNLEEVKHKAEEQNEELNQAMEREPQLKQAVEQLERYYETRVSTVEKEQTQLSPGIEEFLREATKRFE
ncbi:PAC2 family protein [Chloroflexota bacterium]